MAIYYCQAQILSRSAMRSAVAAAAYRAGERLTDEQENKIHDYSRRKDVAFNHVFVPNNAPEWAADRRTLWNEVERKEKAINAQLAREFVIALPLELKPEEQIALAKDFAQHLASEGMCADLAVHMKDGNPHAHILCTVRAFDSKKWAAKSKKVYILDKNGNKQYDKRSKTYKCRKENYTNWNSKEFLLATRETYENFVNRALERAKVDVRVSCKSLAEQGIDRLPTIHEGYAAREIEKRGSQSDRCEINRQIKAVNAAKTAQNHDIAAKLEFEVQTIQNEIKTLEKAYNKLNRFVNPQTLDDYIANARDAEAAYERHKKTPRPGLWGVLTGKRAEYDRKTKILRHDAEEYIFDLDYEQERLAEEQAEMKEKEAQRKEAAERAAKKEREQQMAAKPKRAIGFRRRNSRDRGRGR